MRILRCAFSGLRNRCALLRCAFRKMPCMPTFAALRKASTYHLGAQNLDILQHNFKNGSLLYSSYDS